ncbi:hypothetical protein Tco_1266095 [Tanacetum coccineum]
MEASTELRKSVFGTDIDAEDYAKKMVELVEKRRREIREQKLKAKKNKPMTQAEQRNYMMNYVRSQGHGWTIPQLKKLSFEELKVQFERTIRSIENFIPMDSEKEKESLKRSGETLQGAEKKKQKVLDVEDIPIPESAKFVKEEEIEVKQPVLKMSRRKSKLEKDYVCIVLQNLNLEKLILHPQRLCNGRFLDMEVKVIVTSSEQIKGIQCL